MATKKTTTKKSATAKASKPAAKKGAAPKKTTAKKPAAKAEKGNCKMATYEVVFREVHGKSTNCNFSPYAYIEATDAEEAKRFALEDMLEQEWSDVEVSWPDEECEIDEDLYEFTFSFDMNGKHGKYGGVVNGIVGGSDTDARDKILKDLEKGGITFSTEIPFLSVSEN